MKPRHTIRHILPAATLATIVFTLAMPSAQAGWLPTAGTNEYLDNGNWDGDVINEDFPATLTFTGAQTATFSGDYVMTAPLTCNYLGNFSLTLRADGGGDRSLTLGGNVTVNTAGGTTANVTIGSNTNNQRLNVNLGGVTRTFDIAASRTMTLNNVISNGGITKDGSGTLILLGANSYSGAVTINEGTLSISTINNVASANGLGQSSAAASNLLLGNGTTLRYTGAAASTDRGFTINGTSPGDGATLDASGTGALTFSNTATPAYGTAGQTRTLTLAGTQVAGNTLAADIANNGAGAVSLAKSGAGTWVLTGTNSYTGTTTISGGVLQYGSLNSIGGSGSDITINSGGAISFGFDATPAVIQNILDTRIVPSSDGGIALLADTSADLNFSTASLSTSLGAVGTVTYTGTLTPNGSDYFLKGGGGTLILPNTNALAGANTLTIGSLKVILAASNNLSGITTISSGGTLQLGTGETGTNGSIGSSSIVNNSALIFFNGDAQTYSGVISGTGSLTKNGTGLLTLTGTNTFSGVTTLNGGIQLSGSSGAIPNTSALTLNGGSLQLVNDTTEGGVDRFKNSTVTTSNGGAIIYTNTDGTSLVYGEQIGNLTTSLSQTDVVLTNSMTGGSTQTLTMGALARNIRSAVTFSNPAGLDGATNAVIVTNSATTAGQIFSPGATVGTASNAQTDYAVFETATSNRAVVGAGIAGSTEDTWTVSGNAYTMSSNATLTGTRTITALRNSGAAHTLNLGANNLLTFGILNGDAGLLTINGAGAIKQQGTAANNLFLTAGAGDITINAPVTNNTGALSLVKSGTGTVTLNGAVTLNAGITEVNAGTLTISSSSASLGVVNVNAGGTLNESVTTLTAGQTSVGSAGTAPAIMNYTGGSATNGGNLRVGPDSSGSGGSYGGHVLNVTDGTITFSSNNSLTVGGSSTTGGGTGTINISGASTVILATAGSNHFDVGYGAGSVGYVNLMDGKAEFKYGDWGLNGSAYCYQTGGEFKPTIRIALGFSGDGETVYTLAGGLFNNLATASVGSGSRGTFTVLGGNYSGQEISLGGTVGKRGVLNVAGGTVTTNVYSNNIKTSGVSLGNNANATGILNIASGQLRMTGGISGSVGNAGTINLSGGTIEYLGNASSINYSAQYDPWNPTKTWMGGFTHAFVFPGGTTVNTGTFTGAFSQALEGATGSGVTSVTLTNSGGAGYQAQPSVSFTGGTLASGVGDLGVEAQAVAVWDKTTGKVTNVVIVNPGQYSVAPTGVVISGGGATTTATANLTTGSNSGGGLTKSGTGTLTLSAPSTYDGDTTVLAGTLSLTSPNTNDETSTVTIASDAFLNLNFGGTDTVGSLVIGTDPPLASGEYGAIGSGAENEIDQITGSGTLFVGEATSSPYEDWVGTGGFELTGTDADFDYDYDGDGIANGMEWILGGNPTVNDLATTQPTVTGNATDGLTLVFNRESTSISTTTLVVEWDTDLAGGFANSVTVGTTDVNIPSDNVNPSVDIDAPSVGKVSVRIPAVNAVGGKLFGRLKASQP